MIHDILQSKCCLQADFTKRKTLRATPLQSYN